MYMHKYIHCVHVPDFNRPGRKLIYWCKLKTLQSKNYCQKVDALIAKQKLLPKIGKKKSWWKNTRSDDCGSRSDL